jgi:uncharacterized protein
MTKLSSSASVWAALFVALVLWCFAQPTFARDQSSPDVDIDTPAVGVIKKSIAARFAKLKPYFDAGAIGLTHDGLVAVRDLALVAPAERVAAEAHVGEENKDRSALYREIARANGRTDWESDLKRTFGERWISRAYVGWYYRDSAGKWNQKG